MMRAAGVDDVPDGALVVERGLRRGLEWRRAGGGLHRRFKSAGRKIAICGRVCLEELIKEMRV